MSVMFAGPSMPQTFQTLKRLKECERTLQRPSYLKALDLQVCSGGTCCFVKMFNIFSGENRLSEGLKPCGLIKKMYSALCSADVLESPIR